MKIFISHSSRDVTLAHLLIQLLSSSLCLRAADIRCTSVEGYQLPGGANFTEQIRSEILSTPCFIGVISTASLESIYVLFELGARWGAEKSLIPLLAPGVEPSSLKGPLAGLNALRCDNGSQLHQLIDQVSSQLEVKHEPPAVYQRYIEEIVSLDESGRRPPVKSSDRSVPKSEPSELVNLEGEYSDAETVIKKHCEAAWPENFSMRSFCLKTQRAALEKLRMGPPSDIPEEIFRVIRKNSALKWPSDYSMRHFTEKQEIASYRKIQE